jgi:CTP:molybdopterin cytidylyltransferase MocA
MTIAAVVLAAGAGSRLGGVAKALLGGERSFLARVVAAARAAGTEDVVVVVGAPFGDAVAGEAHRLGARVAWNPAPARGMASSIAVGFGALGLGAAAVGDAAWLWPVDHPHVRAATLHALVDALAAHELARPVHDGRRGHPPLVARRAWPRLAGCEALPGGARDALAGADAVDVAVDDPGVLRDVDVPADLEPA